MQMTHLTFLSVRSTLTMDKKESRAVIKYLHRKGKTKEIYDDMVKTLGEDSTCYSTVKKWVADLIFLHFAL